MEHIMRDLYIPVQILFILFFAILSPVIAFLLFVYFFLLLKPIPRTQVSFYSLIIGLCLIVINLWQLNSLGLINLYHLNIAQLHSYKAYLTVINNSLINFKYYSINNGLVGICGVFLLLYGLVGIGTNYFYTGRLIALANNQYTKPANNQSQQYEHPIFNELNLGTDLNQIPVMISHKELNQHTLVIGTTGSGKTSTLLNIVYDCCSQNLPLIYLDGKGSIKLVDKISQICSQFGRALKVFSIDPGQNITHLAKYNPLAYGNFTEWKNKIITLLGEPESKGQEHYATEEQSYINLVCEILNKSQRQIDLEAFLGYLSHPDELQKLANKQSPEIARRLVQFGGNNKTNDIIKTLELFYHSHYGHLFSTSKESPHNIINLQQSILNNEIVVFLFDAASFKKDTSQLGKLVINDINSAFSSLGRSGQSVKAFCIFDEFAAYASPNMSNILAMQRDNGMHAVIGTQSIHAISEESQQVRRIAVELIANCNTFIIHKINDAHDIRLLQETIGKEAKYSLHSISDNGDRRVTTNLNDEYILDGSKIRSLKPGYGYICRTAVNLRPQIVKVNYV
ncbi:MAG: Type secretory pathway VirD4 component-like protein [Burkholderiales bacterium]|jgi:ABC-type cobalamin/Fe3+-siderophores transport system ATPase subunit|nr:Type secretory pathway VirD4 component-like protein [Burkholderiales bacterium]